MFSRLCKLCHKSVDSSTLNLRRYRISSILWQEQNAQTVEKILEKEKRVPLIICKRPAFNFYTGKTFTKFEEIPIASKGWHNLKSIGDYFTIFPDYEIDEDYQRSDFRPEDFRVFRLHPKLIENLTKNNIHVPSDIQTIAIPKILSEQHSVLSAETGCGKTIAYLLPLLNQIYRWKRLDINCNRRPNSPFGLIITPSRELAEQIARVAKNLSNEIGIKVRVVTGGRTKKISANPPVKEIDLLIGSFGVISKLTTTQIYKLDYVRHLVLDEAHALFDVTFEDKLAIFLRRINFGCGDPTNDTGFPNSCQLTMVSATKATEMPEFMKAIINENDLNESSTNNFLRVMVPQKFMRVAITDKAMSLLKLVKPKAVKNHQVIIFSNDNSTCDWITLFLNDFGIRVTNLNGEMPMAIRKGKFVSFQNGEFSVLSATNAGARGLDTVNVTSVINYDFPMETADYIHRCGRTGRLGSSGDCRVTNLVCRRFEIDLTQKIERATRRRRPLPIFNMLEEVAVREERATEKGDIVAGKGKSSRRERKTEPKTRRRARSDNGQKRRA